MTFGVVTRLRIDIGRFPLHLWPKVREGERLRLHPDRTAPTPARDQQLSQRGREGAGGEAGSQQRCPGVPSFSHFVVFLFALLVVSCLFLGIVTHMLRSAWTSNVSTTRNANAERSRPSTAGFRRDVMRRW